MRRALRVVRLRRGLFLAPPPDLGVPVVPYRLETLLCGGPPFLPPVRARLRRGAPTGAGEAPAFWLDASGLLPLARRFARTGRRPGRLRRDRAEAAAVLAAVDAALEAAADRLLPAACVDLSPESVFLAYGELQPEGGPDAVPPLTVRVACVPCQIAEGTFAGREELVGWLSDRGLLERPRDPVARPPLRLPDGPGLRRALPALTIAGEVLALAVGYLLSRAGLFAALPVVLVALAAADAALLLHPRSPLRLRGAPPADGTAGAPERTVRLSTVGAVTRMGILSEHEPGTFEEAEGRRWFILVDEFLVGRDADRADLVPDAPGVSRAHARIRRLGGVFTVEDLSSRNGTFLDGRRLDAGEERVLPERCTLRFAAASYWFRVE